MQPTRARSSKVINRRFLILLLVFRIWKTFFQIALTVTHGEPWYGQGTIARRRLRLGLPGHRLSERMFVGILGAILGKRPPARWAWNIRYG